MGAMKGKHRRWRRILPLLLAAACMSGGCGGRSGGAGQADGPESSMSGEEEGSQADGLGSSVSGAEEGSQADSPESSVSGAGEGSRADGLESSVSGADQGSSGEERMGTGKKSTAGDYTLDTTASEVMEDPVFEDYGRLIFPADVHVDADLKLKDVGSILPWYSNVKPERTVEIVNYMKEQASAGRRIFYDIYTEEEKAEDPAKENTGLFYFRGNPGEKFAVTDAGGGFMYVAAMHDSFPHALELSKRGYHAFALIYRPGADTACEDLARAIAFIHEHAEELEVDTEDYSLWGGSAGARMAAWLGSYGTEEFGEDAYPAPGAVTMQYTGLSGTTGTEPPTYACVGTRDGIAPYQTMESRIRQIKARGTDAEIEVFDGLSHGFGLGEGTVAEGWLDRAVRFWERNMG